MDEMARAIAGLKDGKAPGGYGIPAEVWKHGGDNLFSRLHQLITNAWEVGSVPQAWKDASIVTLMQAHKERELDAERIIHQFSLQNHRRLAVLFRLE